MDKGDLISVVIPVYNVGLYLERCLNSVVYQTYTNLEIVLIDDGSTDESGLICDEWAQKDNRIRVIHKKNGGLSDARNYGIKEAHGDYLMFVDSDDAIALSMIQILYDVANRSRADIVFCDYGIEEQIIYRKCNGNIEIVELDKMEALQGLYNEKHIKMVIACGKLYKRHLFNNNAFEVGRIHEDEWIMHKLLDESRKIIYVDIPLYFYFQREGSISNDKKSIKNLDYLYALEDRMAFFYDRQYDELYKKTVEVFLDMNIYYSTFIENLSDEIQSMLLNKFAIIYKDERKKIKAPFYKKVLWCIYNKNPGFVQYILKIIKVVFYSKKQFQYK